MPNSITEEIGQPVHAATPLIAHAFANRNDALEKQRMLFIDVHILVEMPVVPALVIEAPIDLIEKPGQTLVRKARYRYGWVERARNL